MPLTCYLVPYSAKSVPSRIQPHTEDGRGECVAATIVFVSGQGVADADRALEITWDGVSDDFHVTRI